MGIKNLLVWNPDPHPNLVGYDVAINAGGPTTVPSNVFIDTAAHANQTVADAIVYSVTANVDLTKGPSVREEEIPDAPVLRVSRISFDETKFKFCLVSGCLVTIAGVVPIRPEIRVSVEWRDTPHLAVNGGYLLGDDVSFFANAQGNFAIPLIQETQAFLHIPAAHLHGKFVVPAADTMDLKDIGLEPVDLFRNN